MNDLESKVRGDVALSLYCMPQKWPDVNLVDIYEFLQSLDLSELD